MSRAHAHQTFSWPRILALMPALGAAMVFALGGALGCADRKTTIALDEHGRPTLTIEAAESPANSPVPLAPTFAAPTVALPQTQPPVVPANELATRGPTWPDGPVGERARATHDRFCRAVAERNWAEANILAIRLARLCAELAEEKPRR